MERLTTAYLNLTLLKESHLLKGIFIWHYFNQNLTRGRQFSSDFRKVKHRNIELEILVTSEAKEACPQVHDLYQNTKIWQ